MVRKLSILWLLNARQSEVQGELSALLLSAPRVQQNDDDIAHAKKGGRERIDA